MTDVILIVTAGRGPVECRRAAAAVIDEIVSEAASLGVSVAVDRGEGDTPGSAVISLGGEDADVFARSWAGTVLWVDASARGRGGRKNWYVGVHRAPAPPSSVEIREADVRFETMRAGGPGGAAPEHDR